MSQLTQAGAYLRPGAAVCADNAIAVAPAHVASFEFINDPAKGSFTQT